MLQRSISFSNMVSLFYQCYSKNTWSLGCSSVFEHLPSVLGPGSLIWRGGAGEEGWQEAIKEVQFLLISFLY